MYTQEDLRLAKGRVHRAVLILLAADVPLLAGYVAAILSGSQAIMLALLLAGFIWSLVIGDLKLVPALCYMRFLQDMQNGLRRNAVCILESRAGETCMQDGACVYAVHVRLAEDNESRIFYINASKAALLPPMGSRVQLESYGRHIVNCGAV